MNQTPIASLIKTEGLPSEFQQTVEQWYLPLLHQIVACKGEKTLVIGIQGSQGSGKSTLAQFLKKLAHTEYNLKAVELSLDDFYLSYDARQNLAKKVHPLFATRGVPGTHDTELALTTIQNLKSAQVGDTIDIPRFNKATDDCFPQAQWDEVKGPVDLIIFEGWCVGCDAQPETDLATPINQLEADEDPDSTWRNYVNEALQTEYQRLFKLIEKLVVLKAPSFECVFEWRSLQEQKLAKKLSNADQSNKFKLLDEAGLKRFISHYERLTKHCLISLPAKADWVFNLAEDHSITNLSFNEHA